MNLLNLQLFELAGLIASGDITSRQVTEASIAHALDAGSVLNAFIALDAEGALEQADKLDRHRASGNPLGPLHGVPLAHKDMFYRAGQVSTCGSGLRRSYYASTTATVLTRLDEAGAVTIGRLNMAEFALNPTGHNPHFGDCRNPWNHQYCPGGSSSGSGAAVAGRVIYGALGSDTGGSVRIPSSMCGLTGIKGTYGRVSRFGVMPLSFTYDCIGPLTRSARDCARMLRVVAGYDDMDSTSAQEPVPDYEANLDGDLRGVTIGYSSSALVQNLDPDVARAYQDALLLMESRGAILLAIDIPSLDAISTYSAIVQRCEMASIHARWMRSVPESYAAHVSGRIYAGYGIPAVAYIEALSQRGNLVRQFCQEVFSQVGALVLPTLPTNVPTLEEANLDSDSPETEARFGALTDNTRPFNYLGLPAMSVPCGMDRRGLPIGLQIIGRPFAEHALLKLAAAYQQDTRWHLLSPSETSATYQGI